MSAHVFVVPGGGEISGGNLYNAGLLGALRGAGVPCVAADVAGASRLLEAGEPGLYWVDTLFLDAFSGLLRARRSPRCSVGLLLHYLPSLVEHGDRWTPGLLSPAEAEALRGAEAFLVSGAFMAQVVARAGSGGRPLLRVEPATEGAAVARGVYRPGPEPITALVVANLVEGKGVLPLLRSLSGRMRGEDGLRLDIVGRFDMDPAHAEACRSVIAGDEVLCAAARLLGPRAPEECGRLLQGCDLFVSASRMESYGMALAEARACGRVLVARAGGNAAAHVDAAAGGLLCEDEAEVAAACIALARDREDLARRSALAVARAPRARSWREAASDYLHAARALTAAARS